MNTPIDSRHVRFPCLIHCTRDMAGKFIHGETREGVINGNRWTKVGKDNKAVYHRFQDDGNGNWHWNGSTNSTLKDGTPNPIQLQNVPNEIIKK